MIAAVTDRVSLTAHRVAGKKIISFPRRVDSHSCYYCIGHRYRVEIISDRVFIARPERFGCSSEHIRISTTDEDLSKKGRLISR